MAQSKFGGIPVEEQGGSKFGDVPVADTPAATPAQGPDARSASQVAIDGLKTVGRTLGFDTSKSLADKLLPAIQHPYDTAVGTGKGLVDTLRNAPSDLAATWNGISKNRDALNEAKLITPPGSAAPALTGRENADTTAAATRLLPAAAMVGGVGDAVLAKAPALLRSAGNAITSPESLMTRAANAKASMSAPATTLDELGNLVGGAKTAVARNAISRARAPVYESFARALSAADGAPTAAQLGVAATPEGMPTRPPIKPPVMGIAGQRNAPIAEVPNNPAPSALAEAPAVERQITIPKPKPPSILDADNERFLSEQRRLTSPDPVDWMPRTGTPTEPLPFDASNVEPVAPKPVTITQDIERAIAPSGARAKLSTLRNAPKLVQELPNLTPGPNFDSQLMDGFKGAEQKVIKAEDAVPDSTTVPRQQITDKLAQLSLEYGEKGLDKIAGQIDRLNDTWARMPEKIPWDQFIKAKRSFFQGANVNNTPMLRAYGALMDASSGVSPELAEANKSYSVIRRALKDAQIDTNTGRRIMQVGKTPAAPAAPGVGRAPIKPLKGGLIP